MACPLNRTKREKKSALISSMIRPVGCNVGASPCGQENEAWHGFGCWVSITRLRNEIISNFNIECRFVLLGWHALQSIRWGGGNCRSQVKYKSPRHSKALISLNDLSLFTQLPPEKGQRLRLLYETVPVGSANFSLWALGVPAKEMTSLHSFDVSSEMKSAGRIPMRLLNAPK